MKRFAAVLLVFFVAPIVASAGCLERYVEANKHKVIHRSHNSSMISSTTTSTMAVSTSTTHGIRGVAHDTETVEKILNELNGNESGGLQVAKLTAELNQAGVAKSRDQVAADIRQLDSSNVLCQSDDVMDYEQLRSLLVNN